MPSSTPYIAKMALKFFCFQNSLKADRHKVTINGHLESLIAPPVNFIPHLNKSLTLSIKIPKWFG